MPQDKKEMSRGRKLLRRFLSTLYISSFTFGGGFVIVTFMKKKFVDELHWIDEQEMLDMTAIAQSSPGAIAVNAAILVTERSAVHIIVMIAAFAATFFFGVNVIIIILACAAVGIIIECIKFVRRKRNDIS